MSLSHLSLSLFLSHFPPTPPADVEKQSQIHISLHRFQEEALQWRRTSDRLQSELSKLRAHKHDEQKEEEESHATTIATHQQATTAWREKAISLQKIVFDLEERQRKDEFERSMHKHQQARTNLLEKEVLKLRTSATQYAQEIIFLKQQHEIEVKRILDEQERQKEKEIEKKNVRNETLKTIQFEKENDQQIYEKEKMKWKDEKSLVEAEMIQQMLKEKTLQRNVVELENQIKENEQKYLNRNLFENEKNQNKIQKYVQEKSMYEQKSLKREHFLHHENQIVQKKLQFSEVLFSFSTKMFVQQRRTVQKRKMIVQYWKKWKIIYKKKSILAILLKKILKRKQKSFGKNEHKRIYKLDVLKLFFAKKSFSS
jgi:hypothetical protein